MSIITVYLKKKKRESIIVKLFGFWFCWHNLTAEFTHVGVGGGKLKSTILILYQKYFIFCL